MINEKYTRKVKEISINVIQTRVDSIKRKDISKTGVRVYDKGLIGYAGAIGKHDEASLLASAKATLDNNITYAYKPAGSLSVKRDSSENIIDEKLLVNEFEELLSNLRNSQPDFIFSNNLRIEEQEIDLVNDNGLDLHYKDSFMDLTLLFKEKTSVNIIDGFISFVGRKYDRQLILKDINEICDAYKNTVALPKEGKLPVVFLTQEILPMLKLLQDLNGDAYGSSSSLFSGKMGQKFFHESFTLFQTNNSEDAAIPFFDAEGTVNDNYRFALIENGILISPYTDKRTAIKYGLPLTGSASAEYDSVPTLDYPTLKIKESDKTIKQLLKGEPGILVMVASGGDFTPEGNFATPVQVAFLFDGERLIGRLPELNLTSNVFDMFGDSFIGVSSNTINPLVFDRYLVMNMNVSKL